MAEGVRSLLAPWIGGAGNAPDAPMGVRSMIAFWMGGAAYVANNETCYLKPTKFCYPTL
jgi:hypothetical protein